MRTAFRGASTGFLVVAYLEYIHGYQASATTLALFSLVMIGNAMLSKPEKP